MEFEIRKSVRLKGFTSDKLSLQIDKCPGCKAGVMKRVMLFDANAPPMHLIKKNITTGMMNFGRSYRTARPMARVKIEGRKKTECKA